MIRHNRSGQIGPGLIFVSEEQNVADSPEIMQKLVDLESLIAHLQHELEQLNSAVIEQNQRIDLLQASQQKFAHQLQTLEEDLEKRDPEDERPPHY